MPERLIRELLAPHKAIHDVLIFGSPTLPDPVVDGRGEAGIEDEREQKQVALLIALVSFCDNRRKRRTSPFQNTQTTTGQALTPRASVALSRVWHRVGY